MLFHSITFAQDSDVQKNNWLPGVIFKLNKMKDTAMEDIRKYESEIQKCDNTIEKSENIVGLAPEKGNVKAEIIAREAPIKAQEANTTNIELKKSAELRKKRAEIALAYTEAGGKDLEARLEQIELESSLSAYVQRQKQLIEERRKAQNPYASAVLESLKINAPPPPPPSKYDGLQPGDVLLINAADIPGLKKKASHTVIFLKKVNGKKLFLDNQPIVGPRIISEDEFEETYKPRGAKVARPKLAEPLDAKQVKDLFSAAVKMDAKNRKAIAQNPFGLRVFGTNYGATGEDNVVCSEADWELLKAAGVITPPPDDWTKKYLGIDFSPADFFNEKYFLVSPLFPLSVATKEYEGTMLIRTKGDISILGRR